MDSVRVERAPTGITTVTLNRPEKKNAMDPVSWAALADAFADLRRDGVTRVVVLTGAGGNFCSGADLTGGGDRQEHQLVFMRTITDVASNLNRLPMPVIAKVRGVSVGAGCSLALGCDLVVAAEDARFSLIFARRGLSLDCGASWLLPRRIGMHKAKEMAFLAEVISAQEAERMGVVNRIVADADIDAFVDDWATRLAEGPPLALAQTKTLLHLGQHTSIEDALEAEGAAQTVNLASEDVREGMAAFVEKRSPRFRGR